VHSYVNKLMGHHSLIDYMFMSNTLFSNVADLSIIDDPCNLFDHLLLVGKINVAGNVPAVLHASKIKIANS